MNLCSPDAFKLLRPGTCALFYVFERRCLANKLEIAVFWARHSPDFQVMTAWIGCILPLVLFSAGAAGIDFATEIQPIFAKHCYECHGTQKQKGELRLDARASVFRTGKKIIVPGSPGESDLFHRVTLDSKHEDFMPRRGGALSKREIDLLRNWISHGAPWPEDAASQAKHWAYVAPRRPALPNVKNRRWPKNGIDYFVLARLEAEPLAPSPQADKARLI